MRLYLVICLAAAFASSCRSESGQGEPPRPDPEPPVPQEIPDTAPPEPAVEAPAADPKVGGTQEDPAVLGSTPRNATTPSPSAPRDLGSELRAALGNPADCVRDFQPASSRTVRVDITGVVRATGMIIEPSARGAGLSRNDQRCIEQRVGAIVLAPLSGNESKPVSTHVDVELTPPQREVVESYDVAPPPPPPDNVLPSLPKKEPIAPSGQPIEGPSGDPIEGPSGDPIEGPAPVPIEGPAPVPIESG